MAQSQAITPDVEDRLVELIRQGNHPVVACQATGISPSTYNLWIRRGEYRDRGGNPTPEQVRFAKRMREAEANAETELVAIITNEDNLKKNPELALKFLARRYPDRWGEKKEININWVQKAVTYITNKEMTLQDLIDEGFGPQLVEQVKALLPPDGGTVEGTYTKIEDQVQQTTDVQ